MVKGGAVCVAGAAAAARLESVEAKAPWPRMAVKRVEVKGL
jgi:hypothetical protein